MDAKDIAAILSAIAWPVTLLMVVIYFRTPIRAILNRFADSLKVKSLKFGFLEARLS